MGDIIQTLTDSNIDNEFNSVHYNLSQLTSAKLSIKNNSGVTKEVIELLDTVKVNPDVRPISELDYEDDDDEDDDTNEYEKYKSSKLFTWPKYQKQSLKQGMMNTALIAEHLYEEYITGEKDYVERAMHKLYKGIIDRNRIPPEEKFIFQFYAYTHATKIISLLQSKEISEPTSSKVILKRQFIKAVEKYKMNIYPELYN